MNNEDNKLLKYLKTVLPDYQWFPIDIEKATQDSDYYDVIYNKLKIISFNEIGKIIEKHLVPTYKHKFTEDNYKDDKVI